ncbi:hypothetical protein [Streptomyces sp. CBMA152]|uniref:hypothetical protein n=1 Tax=Streptomyces sp. CBMA152 TaxID=1896312 RepID=UPI001660E172|nr:hypothetical protein [Streptomyces sp. CBMA152]MBD0745989.1 hypothetical protein [Streptomyces sp. CBMA152]
MSTHAKRNLRPSPRVLGAVTGLAVLLGGGFAAQAAVADSGGGKPSVTTPGTSAPAKTAKTATPKVADEGKAQSDNAPKVIKPGNGTTK